jgi:hypothetical protein
VDATVRELRARGLEFDGFDLPRLKTVDGIATVDEPLFGREPEAAVRLNERKRVTRGPAPR